jgi:hypothetical protein
MNVEEFKSVLRRLEEIYDSSGDSGRAKDLQKVSALLNGHEHQTIDDFVTETVAMLKKPTVQRKTASANKGIVDLYVRQLLDAGTDQSAFKETLSAVEADKAVRKPEWVAIANDYINLPTGETHINKFETIKAAKDGMRDVFIERFDAESKSGIIDKITRWAS